MPRAKKKSVKFEVKFSTLYLLGFGFVGGIASHDFLWGIFNSIQNLFA